MVLREGTASYRNAAEFTKVRAGRVLPEVIRLDDWGYPIVEGPVTEDLLATAREAVRMCPRLALRLVTTPAAPGNDGRRRPR
jgi:ferredoxin